MILDFGVDLRLRMGVARNEREHGSQSFQISEMETSHRCEENMGGGEGRKAYEFLRLNLVNGSFFTKFMLGTQYLGKLCFLPSPSS